MIDNSEIQKCLDKNCVELVYDLVKFSYTEEYKDILHKIFCPIFCMYVSEKGQGKGYYSVKAIDNNKHGKHYMIRVHNIIIRMNSGTLFVFTIPEELMDQRKINRSDLVLCFSTTKMSSAINFTKLRLGNIGSGGFHLYE